MKAEQAQKLFQLMSEDGMSLRKAAETAEIPFTTAWRIVNSEENADQYARAREERGFFLAEETLEIADNPALDPADKRVRVDTRKWYSSKLNPKNLGDKIDLNHAGNVGLNITKIENVVVDPAKSEQEND